MKAWRQYSLERTGLPGAPEDAAGLHTAVSDLVLALTQLSNGVAKPELLELSAEELRFTLETMASQESVALRLPQLRELERRFESAGIGQIISAVARGIPAPMAPHAIASAWLQGVWSELALSEPRLAGFVGEAHNRSRDEFARLDVQHLQLNPDRIRRAAAEQAVAAMN